MHSKSAGPKPGRFAKDRVNEMDKEKKGFAYGEHVELFPDLSNTVSATECTGLMYKPPLTPDEYESYQTLHSMEIPKKLPSRREIREGIYDDRPHEIRF